MRLYNRIELYRKTTKMKGLLIRRTISLMCIPNKPLAKCGSNRCCRDTEIRLEEIKEHPNKQRKSDGTITSHTNDTTRQVRLELQLPSNSLGIPVCTYGKHTIMQPHVNRICHSLDSTLIHLNNFVHRTYACFMICVFLPITITKRKFC